MSLDIEKGMEENVSHTCDVDDTSSYRSVTCHRSSEHCLCDRHLSALKETVSEEAVQADREVERWLIWSNEHQGWWGPAENGYVKLFSDAGRYSFERASEIVENANKYQHTGEIPNETLVPVV